MSALKLSPELWICHLGTVPYGEALRMQSELRARRLARELPDVALLLEHPPTYTVGRRAGAGELPLSEDFYRAQGIEVVPTDRGGRITYHGPGQLVGYPIVAIGDVVAYVRALESALVAAVADEGIAAHSRVAEGADFTGVWVDARKIASIGVHVSRGVATHGFAVNVENDLEPFSWIVPCGLAGVQMTSLARERARADTTPSAARPLLDRFSEHVAMRLGEALERRPREVRPDELGVEQERPSDLVDAGMVPA